VVLDKNVVVEVTDAEILDKVIWSDTFGLSSQVSSFDHIIISSSIYLPLDFLDEWERILLRNSAEIPK